MINLKQDTTMITASNVRFLTKEPIVGLKIFDGEKLRKRLQITFSSEGNFNMFANKMNQWIGLSVVANYDALDLQLANSQPNSQVPVSQVKNFPLSQMIPGTSILKTENPPKNYNNHLFGSQGAISEAPASQIACSQEKLSQFAPIHGFSQHLELVQFSPIQNFNETTQFQQSQTRPKREETSQNFDAFLLLLSAGSNDTTIPPNPQNDTSALSQSTQIWNTETKDNIFQYPTASTSNTFYSQVPPGPELTQTLRDIPFNPGKKQKKAKTSRPKKNGVDDLLELTIARIIEEKQGGYLDLNDKDLSLKICRKLKSKSFLMLLKRVEHLLS